MFFRFRFDVGLISYGDICPTLIANDNGGVNDLSHGVLYMNELKQVGQIYGTEVEPNPQAGRIYDSDGISPCLDTCQGGCRMPKIMVKNATKNGSVEINSGGVMNIAFPDSKTRRGRVIDGGKISPTLDTGCTVGQVEIDDCKVRIRKLTPRECFRLQGFPDEYFDRAASVNSDSQLYKQAGNSVTVNVIYEIAKRLKEVVQ